MTRRIAFLLSALTGLFALPAQAQPINWIQWDPAYSVGATGGSATGSGITPWFGVHVTYNGEMESLQFGYPSWMPTSTFDGGGPLAPQPSLGMIGLMGGSSNTNTISFSRTVVNPAIAIWSLGSPGIAAAFDFDQPIATLASGGANAEYGGSSIVVTGNLVTGVEGNGVVIFPGMFTSISWSNPVFENYYGFTVGFMTIPVCGVAVCMPEPLSLALLGSGLALTIIVRRRRSR